MLQITSDKTQVFNKAKYTKLVIYSKKKGKNKKSSPELQTLLIWFSAVYFLLATLTVLCHVYSLHPN